MKIDFFNPRSLICFIAILQGLIFAVMLILRFFRGRQKADLWLAVLLVLLCLSLIPSFIGFANVYDNHQWLTYFPFAIAYGSAVCVWFYVVYLTNSNRKFLRRDLLFSSRRQFISPFDFFFLRKIWNGRIGLMKIIIFRMPVPLSF